MSMIYSELDRKILTSIFSILQVQRVFGSESAHGIRVQLARFVERGLLVRLKQGLFRFADRKVDELVVAHYLYQPSYVSLETALSLCGLIPEIPAVVTCVTTVTTNEYRVEAQTYRFSRIKKELFFGFETKTDSKSGLQYHIAHPEKAFLDWVYVRKIASLDDMRLDSDMNQERLTEYMQWYPAWVRKVAHEQFIGTI
jgi:predicted transcriptional regulator of viral defense system